MSSPLEPEPVIQNRHLGFLIWQSIPSSAIFLVLKLFILSAHSILSFLFTFFTFHLSQLAFSFALSIASSPQLKRPASPLRLFLALLSSSWSPEFRRRAVVSLTLMLFVAVAAVSGFVSVLSVCLVEDYDGTEMIWRVGFRGFICGLFYALFYVYKQRWVLEFPIIQDIFFPVIGLMVIAFKCLFQQRSLFFSFKMGLPSAIKRALKLAVAAFLFSVLPVVFLADQRKSEVTIGKFMAEQITFYIGCFAVFLCWELDHHLHQVIHTKRFTFAPPKGSAAAETNPSEPLLAALERNAPSSLLQYLAYIDLCMVCENNVDTWRRAAFFEETSETYRRVIDVCLKPLKQLATKLGEGMKVSSVDKDLSSQLLSPTDMHVDSKYSEELNNFQLCAWCARSVASLTAHSHKEDRFGVAQLSGSNVDVLSTLVSCLLAVEAFMGKKTNLQAPHHLMGPAGIKWAQLNTGRRDVGMVKKRGGVLHSKAYAMADVLRISIYCIVSVFHDEMISSAKAGLLEKDWLVSSKPLFGTRELLLQKLRLFLDFQAC